MESKVCVCVFLGLLVSMSFPDCSRGSEETSTPKDAQTPSVGNSIPIRQAWKEQEKQLKSLISATLKRSMSTMMREIYSRNISSLCLSALLQMTGALRQTKLWAFQMLDASGKLPIGMLSGTLTTLGNFEECVEIDIDKPRVKVKGQYCLVDIMPPLPPWSPYTSIHYPPPELTNFSDPDTLVSFLTGFVHNLHLTTVKTGICLPDSCTRDDAENLIQIIPQSMSVNWKFSINRCETKTSFQYSFLQWGLVYFFIGLGSLIGLATLANIFLNEELSARNAAGTLYEILLCFSLRRNMKSVSNYSSCAENMRFVHGFVFVSIWWIIVSNCFMCINYDVTANFMEAVRMTKNIIYQVLVNRVTPSQTLFFLSGLMNAYLWMKSPEMKLNVWKYFLKAYWRYTPTYLIVIGLMMITPGWGSGPSWLNYINPIYVNCKNNWWTNMLFVNNYINSNDMCLVSTWYIAVAAQLHVLGIFVLIPLKRRPTLALSINAFFIVISLFTVFFVNMYLDIAPNEIISYLDFTDRNIYSANSYYRVYYHATMYCAGIFAGYVIATKPNMKISHRLSQSVWVLASCVTLGTLALVTLWSDGTMPSPFLCACYDVANKVIWAGFLSWASISCAIEQKGVCHDVMSWKGFTIFSKLSFAAILITTTITTIVFGLKKSHIFVSHFEIFYNMGGIVLCCYVSAYICHVTIESPLHQLSLLIKKSFFATRPNVAVKDDKFHFDGVLSEKTPSASTRNCTTNVDLQKTRVKQTATAEVKI